MVASNIVHLLILGWVGFSVSSVKVYYIDNDDTSSSESYEKKSLYANKRIRLLEEMITRMLEIQSKLPDSIKDKNIFNQNDEYDYDGYYVGNAYKQVEQTDCKGTNCKMLIPGKVPWLITDDKDTSRYRSANIDENETYNRTSNKDYEDSGYDRDDEDDIPVSRCSNNIINTNNGTKTKPSPGCKPTRILIRNTTHTTPKPHAILKYFTSKPIATTTKKKTFDEKTTDEITSADLDQYIPDSFEKRSGNDERKFSTDYLNIDYLMRTYVKNEKVHDSHSRVLNSSGILMNQTVNKDLLRMLRMRPENDYKKGNLKKNSQSRSRNIESDSNTSEEKSSEYKTTKKPKYKTESKVKNKKKKRPKRFEIVKSLNTYNSDSEEPKVQKKSTETIEPVSVEVKPKPKKKSKPRIPGKPEHYIQGPSRVYKERDFRKKEPTDLAKNVRKRMPHFLPKRYHWDPSDFHRLGYFWFNGPQGKVPGPWKISY